jgi:glycosyltransferase involved in cell wall biosynthesis
MASLRETSGQQILPLAPLTGRHSSSDFDVAVKFQGTGSGHLWEQASLPRYSKGILVSLCNTYPILVRRQIVVVHDASIYAVPEGYTRAFVLYYRLLFALLRFKRSVVVVTDSEFSKRELVRHARLDADRIHVVYCGADHWRQVTPDLQIIARLGLKETRYIMAVASENPNKNLDRLTKAFLSLGRRDVRLVLVGAKNSRIFSSEAIVESENIVRAGYVSDSELAALYAQAVGFIFPSLYEGFGLPPLEAMTFDCPVVSSREASLPEVCGDAALYCDARDVHDISRAIQRLLDDDMLRASLIQAGREQLKKFTWKATAQAIMQLAEQM